MKKLKIFSAVLASVLAVGTVMPFVGCGVAENDVNTINISVVNKGYKTEWITSLMTDFLASDAKYSGYKFQLYESYDDDTMKVTVESGANTCNYDLIFHGGNPTLIDDKYLTDISSVYNMSFKDKTLKDYMDESIVSSFVKGDKFTSIPWTQSISSVLINYGKVTEKLGAGWENTYKNRTTDEFMTFINALKDNGVTPFVITNDKNFYHVLYETWWAQYEGMSGVKDFFTARYYDEIEGTYKEGPEAFRQEGRLKSVQTLAAIFSNESNYAKYNSGYAMQTAYMEGKSAMIANGDWMQTEQGKKYSDVDMRFIKTPVISALGTKLGITESKLIEIIDYVDGVAAKPADITDAQIDKVTEARKIVYSTVDYSCACIPEYSIKKDVALDFLKWMYSEAGQRKYVAAMNGLTLPIKNSFKDDASVTMSVFAKSAAALAENAVYLFPNRNWKYAKAGLQAFAAREKGVIEYLLTGKSGSEYTPEYICDYDYQYYTKNNGNNWKDLQNRVK